MQNGLFFCRQQLFPTFPYAFLRTDLHFLRDEEEKGKKRDFEQMRSRRVRRTRVDASTDLARKRSGDRDDRLTCVCIFVVVAFLSFWFSSYLADLRTA